MCWATAVMAETTTTTDTATTVAITVNWIRMRMRKPIANKHHKDKTRKDNNNKYQFCVCILGLGYCTLTVITFVTIYYMVIISWIVFYFVASFSPKLGWGYCDHEFNSKGKCEWNHFSFSFICAISDFSSTPFSFTSHSLPTDRHLSRLTMCCCCLYRV